MIAVCWLIYPRKYLNLLTVKVDGCIRTDYEAIIRKSDGCDGIVFYNLTKQQHDNITLQEVPIPLSVWNRIQRGEITEVEVLHAIERGD